MTDLVVQPDVDMGKSRRLVPQFSLTKQDLGADNSIRHKTDTPKKPVIRFTREQLIAMRKESSMLPSMGRFLDIVSIESLQPVCFQRLEPEDVSKMYSMAAKEGHGRGRARGLKFPKTDEVAVEPKKSDSLWDDEAIGTSETFDLADFAKAALKFRSDMEDLKANPLSDLDLLNQDALGSLAQEQQNIAGKNPVEGSLTSLLLESSVLQEQNSKFPASIVDGLQSSLPQDDLFANGLSFGTSFGLFSVPEKPVSTEWFYRDPQGDIQGPFSQENMKHWNHEGFFSPDLPIRMSGWHTFHLFREVFPNSHFAFVDIPKEPKPIQLPVDSSIPSAPVAASPSIAVDSVSVSQQLNTLKAIVEAVESLPEIQTADQVVAHNVEKSDFAKKLLGIGQKSAPSKGKESKPVSSATTSKPQKAADNSTSNVEAPKNTPMLTRIISPEIEETKAVKGWNNNVAAKSVVKLTDIQQQQQRQQQQHDEVKPMISQISVQNVQQPGMMSIQLKSLLGVKQSDDSKAKLGWSTPSSSDARSSLNDIMNEELNNKKTVSQSVQNVSVKPTPPPTSWVSKAMGNQPTVTPSVEPQLKRVIASSTEKPIVSDVAPPTGKSNAVASKSDFGGKAMSKELSDWCSINLNKIRGNDDALGLMEFCMSLNSPAEIRSYLSEYLGSSPQVINFATEFIKLKDSRKQPSSAEKANESKFSTVANKKKKTPGK